MLADLPAAARSPYVVAVAATKGGTGKTSIATALAVESARRGLDVLLVDADARQRSAALWAAAREATPRVPCKVFTPPPPQSPTNPLLALRDLIGERDLVLLDAGGADSRALRAVLAVADLVLVPLRAGAFELWSLDDLAGILDALAVVRDAPPPVVLVLNQAPAGKLADEARALLEPYGSRPGWTLAHHVVRARVAWPRAGGSGLSPAEFDAPARADIDRLYDLLTGLGLPERQETSE